MHIASECLSFTPYPTSRKDFLHSVELRSAFLAIRNTGDMHMAFDTTLTQVCVQKERMDAEDSGIIVQQICWKCLRVETARVPGL